MGVKLFFLVLLFIASINSSFSQEICNNGIDDDGDGLIDGADIQDCNCTETIVDFYQVPQCSANNFYGLNVSGLYNTEWLWDFGNGETSTNQNVNMVLPVGQHTVTLYTNMTNGACADTIVKTITIDSIYTLNLGPDSICYSGPFTLNASANFDSYLWQDGSMDSVLNITGPGVYTVEVQYEQGNVIYNGDFELGSQGFYSDYGDSTGGTSTALWYGSLFAITDDPNSLHPNFGNCGDHTTGNGNMYAANGSPGLSIWCQDIVVDPNTTYSFSTWLTSIEPQLPAVLQFFVNGVPLGNTYQSNGILCDWEYFEDTWFSGTDTIVTICIENLTQGGAGNDFAIDDIFFSPLCTQTKTIYVFEKPNANFNVTDACLNNSTSLIDNSNVNNGNITQWDWNFGDGSANSNLQNPNHNYLNNGQFQVDLIVTTDQGCTDTTTTLTTVYPLPITNFTLDSVCLNSDVSFNNLSSIINPSIITNSVWSFGDNSTSVDQFNVSHQYAIAGNYTVILTTTSTYGCESQQSKVVEIYSLPIANFNSTTVCVGDSTNFSDLSSNDVVSWQWNFEGNQFSSSENPVLQIAPMGSQNNIELIVLNNNGCIDSTSKPVLFNEQPIIDFEVDKLEGCSPVCVNFSETNNLTNSYITNWSWDFGNGETSNLPNPESCFINNSNTTDISFSIKLIVTNNFGCIDSIFKQNYITSWHNPVAIFSVETTDDYTGTNLDFINTSIGASYYDWDFDNDNFSSQFEPNYFYTESGDYDINLVAITDNFCVDSTIHSINYTPPLIYYVPNVFTPDFDDYNQIFKPIFTSGYDPYDYHLMIFNRWGELIFESYNSDIGWDGTYPLDGKLCQDDVYVWKIDFKHAYSDKRFIEVGHVTLLK